MRTFVGACCALFVLGCGDKSYEERKPPRARITVDGSSTVLPMTRAIAERYARAAPTIVEAVGSGTGAGFKRLCAGTVAIAGASRPISSAEIQACEDKGIRYIEMPIAFDGISVVVHRDNDWAASMTVAELARLWAPDAQGTVMRWSDVRPGWPDAPIALYGPGAESGTFDYFTKAIVGKETASRTDVHTSENDDELVAGVAGDKNALGYFGFAYYQKNRDRLTLVAIDDGVAGNGDGPIVPDARTIRDGTYRPLSRPLFLYVTATAVGHRQTQLFVDYYLDHVAEAAIAVGDVPLPPELLRLSRRRFTGRQLGSAFSGAIETGLTVAELLEAETATVVAEPATAAKPTSTN